MDAISDVSRGSEIFSSVPEFPPLPKPLNLDDLFGFSEAGRKKLVVEPVETKYFIANKIFINQVDSFTGRHIVKFLSGKDRRSLSQENVMNDTDQSEVKANAKRTITNEEKYDSPPKVNDIPNIPLQAKSDNNEGIIYDTSKLTIAEFYEMMELESHENRIEFVKDKLAKFYTDSNEVNLSKNELEQLPHDKPLFPDAREIEYEITGTLKNPDLEDIEGITDIIRVPNDDPEFLKQIVTCGTIIYCVNENLDQTTEATRVLNYIINFINDLRLTQHPTTFCCPIFVLVSTFMTWSLTKPLSKEEELPFNEKDYRKRKPHPNYNVLYELEEQLIKAKFIHRIKSVVIVSGIPYGHEENELRFLFDKAYYFKHLPIYSLENKNLPLIHVENLGKIVKETIKKIDYVTIPFIFAKDPVQYTMLDISKAVSSYLGTGYCEFQSKEVAFINDMISQDVYDKITNELFLESCYPVFKEEDLEWKYELGFIVNINHIVKEFIDASKIKPLRIILYGGSQSDRFQNIAKKISDHFNIPYIHPQSIVSEYCDEVLQKQTKFEEQRQHLNNSNNFSPPLELILCDDWKCIDNELEVLKKFNINCSEDTKLLQESDKISILARKLKMRPYIYHGFIMEEYPLSLEEATALFSENCKETFDENSLNEISILPDFVIFFNELKDEENMEPSIFSGQQEKNNLETEESVALKLFEEELSKNYEEHASDANDSKSIEEKNTVSIDEAANSVIHNPIFSFFTNFEKQCLAVTLDISESDDEEQIFNKTMKAIQKSRFPQDCIASSSSINEHDQSQQNISYEENKTNLMPQNSKLQGDVENNNIEGLKEAEEIILAVRSYPLISYLINSISPTLTNGILEVTALMSQDPIDVLAEYIFKNNPDGRMMPQNESKLDDLMRNKGKPVQNIDSKTCLS